MKVKALIDLIGVSKENNEAREEFSVISCEVNRLRKIEDLTIKILKHYETTETSEAEYQKARSMFDELVQLLRKR